MFSMSLMNFCHCKTTLLSIDHVWRLFQNSRTFSSSLRGQQQVYHKQRGWLLKEKMSRDPKKTGTQKCVWRPVTTQAKLQQDDKVETSDTYSNTVERKSSVTSTKRVITNSKCEAISGSSQEKNEGTELTTTREVQGIENNLYKEKVNIELEQPKDVKQGLRMDREYSTELSMQESNQSTDSVNRDKDIETTDTMIHSATVKVGLLQRFIKGKSGNVQRRIEREAGVMLNFVGSGEGATIVIQGTSDHNVKMALEIIQEIIDEAVESPFFDYSHFISIPLAHQQELVQKLIDFQNNILGTSGSSEKEEDSSSVSDTEHCGDDADSCRVKLNVEDDEVSMHLDTKKAKKDESNVKERLHQQILKIGHGIEKSIFIKPATFHLTVLMLKLWNDEQISAAMEVLQKVSPQINNLLEGRPLAVKLRGLELMRGTPKKANVLYAPVNEVDGGGRLQHACKIIIDAFKEAGLVQHKDAKAPLKLHATLMNSRHRKAKGYRKNIPFDASRIIEDFGSADWGEYVITEFQLSKRFSYDETGYYHCCMSAPLPQPNSEALNEEMKNIG